MKMRSRLAAATGAAALVLAPLLALAPAAQAGGGGCRHTEGVTQAKGVRVALQAVCFTPTIIWAAPNQTITWTNQEDLPHNVISTGFRFSSGDLAEGQSFAFRFTSPGIYPYACAFHPGMTGAVVVGTPVAPAKTIDIGQAGFEAPVQRPPSAAGAALIDGGAALTGSMSSRSNGRVFAVVAALAVAAAAAAGFGVGRARARRCSRHRLQSGSQNA